MPTTYATELKMNPPGASVIHPVRSSVIYDSKTCRVIGKQSHTIQLCVIGNPTNIPARLHSSTWGEEDKCHPCVTLGWQIFVSLGVCCIYRLYAVIVFVNLGLGTNLNEQKRELKLTMSQKSRFSFIRTFSGKHILTKQFNGIMCLSQLALLSISQKLATCQHVFASYYKLVGKLGQFAKAQPQQNDAEISNARSIFGNILLIL